MCVRLGQCKTMHTVGFESWVSGRMLYGIELKFNWVAKSTKITFLAAWQLKKLNMVFWIWDKGKRSFEYKICLIWIWGMYICWILIWRWVEVLVWGGKVSTGCNSADADVTHPNVKWSSGSPPQKYNFMGIVPIREEGSSHNHDFMLSTWPMILEVFVTIA